MPRLIPSLVCLLAVGTTVLQAQTSPPGGSEPGGPRRIIIGGPGVPPAMSPEAKAMTPPKNDDELATAVGKLADTLSAKGQFSGSIDLAKDGKALIDGAWGLADQANKIANTPDTAFDVGSIGKMFTQTAVLQLAEAGRLALDEPFGKYLKDYPNRKIADTVTLRQLLLHTSGMGDIFDHITPDTDLPAMTELKDILPLFVQKPLEFAPGTTNRYSNAGYIVLGMVVEAVSGENYFDYVLRHILKPAGMTHSGFFDRRHLPPTVAHSYAGADDLTLMHLGRGSPAGGLQSTARDLNRFVQAVNGGLLLNPASVKMLREFLPHPPNAPRPADETKLMAYGIEGGAPGVSAQLVVDPTGHYVRIVLCNGGPPMAMSMAFTIREWMRQLPN